MSFEKLQARCNVPEVLLQEIKSLNTLDMELYKYAEDIFARKHKHMVQKSGNTVSALLFQD